MRTPARLIPRHAARTLLCAAAVSWALLSPAPRAAEKKKAPSPPPSAPDKASDGTGAKPYTPPPGTAGAPPPPQEEGLGGVFHEPPPEVRREQEVAAAREAAIEKARVDLAAKPDDPEPLSRLVDLLLSEQESEKAVEEARAFVTRQPGIALGSLALGRAFCYRGEYDLALLQFQRAAGLQPAERDPAFWQAKVLSIQGRGDEALAILRKLAEKDASDTGVWASLGYQLEEARSWAEAASAWERVAALKETKKQDNRVSSMRTLLCRDLAGRPPRLDGVPAGGIEVPFQSLNGMPAVRVRINQRLDRLLLIDMSSQDVMLVSSVARDLQIPEYGGPSYDDTQGFVGMRAAVAVLDSLQIGTIAALRVPVDIKPRVNYPSKDIAGVLGRRFFRDLLLTVDWAKGVLRISPAPEKAIDGAPLYVSQALLTDGMMNGEVIGKFVVGTSTFTPGPISAIWAQRRLGILPGQKGTRPLFQNNYLYTFTLPHLEIGGASWTDLRATGTDYRSLSTLLQTEIVGGLSSAMLRGMRATFDLRHQRLRLERVAPPATPAAGAGQAPPPRTGTQPGTGAGAGQAAPPATGTGQPPAPGASPPPTGGAPAPGTRPRQPGR